MTRYILHPGHVRSRADGDWHFIGASQLALLYGVPNGARCVVANDDGYLPLGFAPLPSDVHLHPRSNGRYRLPVVAPAPLEPGECCPHNAEFDLALAAGRLQAGLAAGPGF